MMARSIDDRAPGVSQVGELLPARLWKLRLSSGLLILFAALVGLFALIWDIQWHIAVGRDRTLTAPHLFILGSVTVMGLTALTAVLLETVWARRSASIARRGTPFAGLFSSSQGVYLVGFGALNAAIAFPIDQYWHTIEGIDVAIWAPFHVMLLTGFCVCALGVADLLVEGAHLAAQVGAKGAARAEYAGAVVAFATLMGMLSILLTEALSTGYISLGRLTFTVYPLMLGAFGTFVLIAAMRALPGRATATWIALVYASFGMLSFLLIPPLMSWLLGIEQLSLLPRAPRVSVLATEWQYPLVVAAVLLDMVAWLARRRKWSWEKHNRALLLVASIGMSLAALFYPFFIRSQFLLTAQYHVPGAIKATGIRGAGGMQFGNVMQATPIHLSMPVAMIVVVSLLLGVLGTCLGSWLGAGIGELMQRKGL